LGENTSNMIPPLPDIVTLTGRGSDWLRYQTDNPMQANPLVVQSLVKNNIPVVELFEVPRSLEKVYLQAINNIENNDGHLERVVQVPSGGENQHAG
jgi:hypothetical protein